MSKTIQDWHVIINMYGEPIAMFASYAHALRFKSAHHELTSEATTIETWKFAIK